MFLRRDVLVHRSVSSTIYSFSSTIYSSSATIYAFSSTIYSFSATIYSSSSTIYSGEFLAAAGFVVVAPNKPGASLYNSAIDPLLAPLCALDATPLTKVGRE